MKADDKNRKHKTIKERANFASRKTSFNEAACFNLTFLRYLHNLVNTKQQFDTVEMTFPKKEQS